MITEKQINALWSVLREHMEPPFMVRVQDHEAYNADGQVVIDQSSLRAAEAECDANTASLFRRALEAAQLVAGPQVAVVEQTGECTCSTPPGYPHEPQCGLQLIGMANFEDAAAHMGWLRPRRVWFEDEIVPAGPRVHDGDGTISHNQFYESQDPWKNEMGTVVESLNEDEWEAAVRRAVVARKANPA